MAPTSACSNTPRPTGVGTASSSSRSRGRRQRRCHGDMQRAGMKTPKCGPQSRRANQPTPLVQQSQLFVPPCHLLRIMSRILAPIPEDHEEIEQRTCVSPVSRTEAFILMISEASFRPPPFVTDNASRAPPPFVELLYPACLLLPSRVAPRYWVFHQGLSRVPRSRTHWPGNAGIGLRVSRPQPSDHPPSQIFVRAAPPPSDALLPAPQLPTHQRPRPIFSNSRSGSTSLVRWSAMEQRLHGPCYFYHKTRPSENPRRSALMPAVHWSEPPRPP